VKLINKTPYQGIREILMLVREIGTKALKRMGRSSYIRPLPDVVTVFPSIRLQNGFYASSAIEAPEFGASIYLSPPKNVIPYLDMEHIMGALMPEGRIELPLFLKVKIAQGVRDVSGVSAGFITHRTMDELTDRLDRISTYFLSDSLEWAESCGSERSGTH